MDIQERDAQATLREDGTIFMEIMCARGRPRKSGVYFFAAAQDYGISRPNYVIGGGYKSLRSQISV